MADIKIFHGADHVATFGVSNSLSVIEALESAYHQTQNLEGSWSRPPSDENQNNTGERFEHFSFIAPLREIDGKIYGHRSSMVGDRFEFHSITYRVGGVGFISEFGKAA